MTNETTDRVKAAQEALQRGLAALNTDEDWKAVLTASATLGKLSPRRYSFANQLLLISQGADMRAVAGFKTWLSVNRHVVRGAKSHAILAPVPFKRDVKRTDAQGVETTETLKGVRFRVVSVFDVSQTDGEPLPEPKELPRIDAPEVFEQSIERLRDVALGLEGAPVSAIRFQETDTEFGGGAKGWYCRLSREIVIVTGGRNRAEQFKTLVHEVAHSLLHGTSERHERPVCEVEAESVAFIVSHALGLDTGCYSFPYVAVWAQNGGDPATKVVARVGERIVKAANTILDALNVGGEASEKVAEEVAA